MDGIHSTGLGTRTLLLDNGIIRTGFQTLSAFDAFFSIDHRPPVFHVDSLLGTDLDKDVPDSPGSPSVTITRFSGQELQAI